MIVRDPTLLYTPWVRHYFPGFDPRDHWSIGEYVAMWDFVPKGGS